MKLVENIAHAIYDLIGEERRKKSMEPYNDKIKAAVKKLKENPTEYNRDALLILLAESLVDLIGPKEE